MPLIKDGHYYYWGAANCDVLASHFAQPLSSPTDDPQFEANSRYLDEMCRSTPSKAPRPISGLEVRKALGGMPPQKAPGTDGLTTETLQNLPALHGPLASLFALIPQKGRIPRDVLQLFFLLLDKPGKSRSSCGAKRPIPLLRAISKGLETVALYRLMPLAEPRFNPAQFAYQRERGAKCTSRNFLISRGSMLRKGILRLFPVLI